MGEVGLETFNFSPVRLHFQKGFVEGLSRFQDVQFHFLKNQLIRLFMTTKIRLSLGWGGDGWQLQEVGDFEAQNCQPALKFD